MLRQTSSGEPCGLITNIQKYTIHDGPGIRTSVFFKGCPLRCLWCSNPETISPLPQVGVYPGKCLSRAKCGHCVTSCPEGESLIEFDDQGVLRAVSTRGGCSGCLKCTDACPSGALKRWGLDMTLGGLLKIILEDRSFYLKTGGGVTLNGGEVMLQWEFAAALLKACKEASIGTCVETALLCPEAHMEAVLKHTDIFITDIKHMDSALHKKYTGAPNEQILKNIIRVAESGKHLVIRTPIVHGYNGGEDNIRKTGKFIADELGGKVVQYQLLPYRRMGTEKYESLQVNYPLEDYKAPGREVWESHILYLADMLRSEYGLPAEAGSNKKLELH